mgnify:CR=1 FL=1
MTPIVTVTPSSSASETLIVAIGNCIANMDHGFYAGTFSCLKALAAAAPDPLWLPGQIDARHDLLQTYGKFQAGI